MPRIRIIHEDKDTTQSLNVTMAQGKQTISIAAGGDYEFDLPAGSTVDIAVQKTEQPNATMLQRIGDMMHFRHDTAAGKLNAGKQPTPPTEADLQAIHAQEVANKSSTAQASSTASASPAPSTAASVPSSTNTSAVGSGSVGNGTQTAAPVTVAPVSESAASPSATAATDGSTPSASSVAAPSTEPGAEKAPE